jgi:iron complex transport system ATP-binding protein
MSAPAYHVSAVNFRHSARLPWVLEDVTFTVAPGEFLGVIGPNGSGKTSLLNLLGRLARPQSGVIRLFGDDLNGLTPSDVATAVAMVPQEGRPAFAFSVLDTVLMGRFPHRKATGLFSAVAGAGWESEEDHRIAWRALADTGVSHLAHRTIDTLSGGEWQRVVIARALAQGPRILLLDEPTAHLDLQHQIDICALLRRVNETQRLTIVMVSHDLNLASQYCDRLVLLHEHRIAASGSPERVLSAEILRRVYGCEVLVDTHPISGLPRITVPGRALVG